MEHLFVGRGCDKTKLKQTMQDAFFSSDLNMNNKLFETIMKVKQLDENIHKTRWVSWKKFCDEEGLGVFKKPRVPR